MVPSGGASAGGGVTGVNSAIPPLSPTLRSPVQMDRAEPALGIRDLQSVLVLSKMLDLAYAGIF